MAKFVCTRRGLKLWALNKVEDHILIDAYLSVKPFVPRYDYPFSEFEYRYFEAGDALTDKSIVLLNSTLVRKGFTQLCFPEGHSDSYSLLRGAQKAEQRRDIRDALASMSAADRALVMDGKRTEMRQQAPRDPIYDAVKAKRTSPLEIVGTAKVARTHLTEQLIEGVDAGRLAPESRLKTRPAQSEGKTEIVRAKRPILSLVPANKQVPASSHSHGSEQNGQLLALDYQAVAEALRQTSQEIGGLKGLIEAGRSETAALQGMLQSVLGALGTIAKTA